jgi:hypothetical protein
MYPSPIMISRIPRRGVLESLCLVLFLSLFSSPALTTKATPIASFGDVSGFVEVGNGRHLYLECHDTGSPTVILKSGFRTPGVVWRDDLLQLDDPRVMTFLGVDETTRVCAYDCLSRREPAGPGS